ncbi:MAG: hypothetical protein IH577_00650 [Deltaproteobacteria bacterium]|nr:hypothetical protein [Deltaproteobacteria bacterium]
MKFPGQFILNKTESLFPEGWLSESIGSWILSRHPSLPGMRLARGDGRSVGWLLGYPIDREGVLLSDGSEIRVPWGSEWSDERVEEFVYGFGGRFLAAFVGDSQKRLYLDPIGSLSLVYCAHQEIVASTPNLIPYDDRTGDHLKLVKDLGIPFTNAKYPLELTPRHNVERLIPNHYLDLDIWKRVRHWPKGPLRDDESVESAAVAVAGIVKRQISAVVSRIPTYLRLTAGGDSRMLLACSKGVADRLELFTVPIGDDGGYLDVAVARKIAKRFGLRHFVPEYRESSREDLADYMDRIGRGTGELRGWRATTMFRQANPAYAQLDSAGGALDRGQYYGLGDTESTRITPERLMERCCQGPPTERTLPPLRRWLQEVPTLNMFHLLDLFFVEQELGCWGGLLPYAEGPEKGFILFPLSHREIITRMMTLPTEYKRHGFRTYERLRTGTPPFMKEIIEREWPELLEWPFNTPFGYQKIVLDARCVWRKIRKKIAS